jgi:putative tryptophan/tyrosine transport system substrate-binding protein
MRRRQVIALLGGAVTASARAVHAEKPATPVIGYLGAASEAPNRPYTAAFFAGLEQSGFHDGRNVVIEYRWAEGHFDRLAALAAELVRDHVDVIFASGGTPVARAAMAATTSIPIVFSIGDDPTRVGLVDSINRPSGNVTGATINFSLLGAKRWELLREMVPKVVVAAVFVDPDGPSSVLEGRQIEEAARTAGGRAVIMNVHDGSGIDSAFAGSVDALADTLFVTAAPRLTQSREQIVALAARHAIPAIYFEREFAAIGGLMSYGAPLRDNYHQAGVYAGQLLKGAKPSDLPVVQGSKIELVINLKTAKALGIAVPSSLMIAADEVIE